MRTHPSLILCWQAVMANLRVPPDKADRAVEPWLALHEGEHRHYHTLRHVYAMTRTASMLSGLYRPEQTPAILLACFFHDSVYDPRAKDNEEQSALRAEESLWEMGLDEHLIARTRELILVTKTHQPGDDLGAAVLCDADLSILGSDASTYNAYALAVRNEYSHVPEEAYCPGRIAVLEKFLKRPAIFKTPLMASEAEGPARANLAREIKTPPRLPRREE